MASETIKLNKLLREVLEDNPSTAWTMGQLMAKADVPKTLAGDVSSALYKLRGLGLVKTTRGPSSSLKGPRFVRTYQWIVVRPVKKTEPAPVSPMAGLGIFRM